MAARAIDPAKTDGQLAVAADDPALAEITRRLVETYRPERIYSFDRQGLGEMQLIAIGASSDYRVEQRNDATVLEFSWSGFDEMDATSGRAWAQIDGDTMRGKLFIHQGYESSFLARRARGAQRVSTSKAPRPPGACGTNATWSTAAARFPQRRPGDRPRARRGATGLGPGDCAKARA